MGLDNGIEIRKVNSEIKLPFKPTYEGDPYLEVCYWRKCWGLRNEIMNMLCVRYGLDDPSCVVLTLKDVEDVLEIVKYFTCKKHWDSEANSIWLWKESKECLRKQAKNLEKLVKIMRKHPGELEVAFYDSY